jgi:hypothetical protein
MSDVGPFGEDEGAGDSGDEDALVQWSETLVAPATLNCFIWLLLALAVPVFELEFMPEFAPVDAVPLAEAVAPACPEEPGVVLALADELLSEGVPVSWTSLPTSRRIASKLPVSL